MAKLKPCPFCGETPKVYVYDGSGRFYDNLGTAVIGGREMPHMLIRCPRCGIKTKAYLTEKGLFRDWNRRMGE